MVLVVAGCHRGPTFDPGEPVVPRLNRAEYDAVVRDLFGTTKRPSLDFPVDESANGFDNQGAALTTTSLHVASWESAAVDLLDEMFGADPESTRELWYEVEDAGITIQGDGFLVGEQAWTILSGSISTNVTVVDDGQYEITVTCSGRGLDGVQPRLLVRVDDTLVDWIDVANTPGNTSVDLVVSTALGVGTHHLEIALDNPQVINGVARVLVVDRFGLRGPLDPEGERTAAYETWVGCFPVDRSCADRAVARFGARAWRRPWTEEDGTWAMGLYDAAIALGETPDYALRLAFRGILLAPDFMYRLQPSDGKIRLLTGDELATRLAAFLWSSLPDETLVSFAADSAIDDGALDAQVTRMLEDPRSSALVDNLAGQWLAIRTIDQLAPAVQFYPDWDEPLRSAMRTEMELLADDFFRSRITLEDLLLGESSWIDQRLAEHYGLMWTGGEGEWLSMSTVGTGRLGLLGTAGWLATQSHADAPSAVLRGKWVLDRLLCDPPPPPPPTVVAVLTVESAGGPVRVQEESRRSDPVCQTCHTDIDGIGFVFGEFDGIGAWRSKDELGYPIDITGELYGKPVFDLPDLMNEMLRDDRVPRCVVEQTLTYALGRPLRDIDAPLVDGLTAEFVAGGLTFDGLAKSIVRSDAFRWRGTDEQRTEEER